MGVAEALLDGLARQPELAADRCPAVAGGAGGSHGAGQQVACDLLGVDPASDQGERIELGRVARAFPPGHARVHVQDGVAQRLGEVGTRFRIVGRGAHRSATDEEILSVIVSTGDPPLTAAAAPPRHHEEDHEQPHEELDVPRLSPRSLAEVRSADDLGQVRAAEQRTDTTEQR